MAFTIAAIVAGLGSLGPADCGSSCTRAAEQWDAGHEPFFALGFVGTAVFLVIALGAGIHWLVADRRAPDATPV